VLQEMAGQQLPDFAKEVGAASFAQLFLKYIVSHPAVTVVIPGTRRVAHLEDNAGAAMGTLPDAALRKRIEQFYDAVPKS
jgi:aryl-alcohol dehydrogenase-like predicted oxidoreductase